MQHQILAWQTTDKLQIYAQLWQPEGEIKAVFCIVHGMGEHSGRYTFLIEHLINQNIAVIAYDQRGHGKSEGKRGHTPAYEYLLSDIKIFLQQAKDLFPQKKIILFGHSMGGNLVLNYVIRKKPKIAGAIASSPWIKLAFEPPKLQITLGKLVNRFYPSFAQSSNLETEALSRDESIVEFYKQDPLIHDKVSARFFLECYQAAEWLLSQKQNIEIPLLLYHGTADRLTSHKGTEAFFEKNKSDFLTFRLWEGGFHESHNDLHKEDVFKWIDKWLVDKSIL